MKGPFSRRKREPASMSSEKRERLYAKKGERIRRPPTPREASSIFQKEKKRKETLR